MSLTHHLDDPDSPVRRYFETTFPHYAQVKFASTSAPPSTIVLDGQDVELRTLKRFAPGDARVIPRPQRDDEVGYNWGAAGAAFDYRVRFLLARQDPSQLIAAAGARNLARRWKLPGTGVAWKQLAEAVAALSPETTPDAAPKSRTDSATDDAILVDRVCVLLALYEQLYRAPAEHLTNHPLVLAGSDAQLDDHYELIDNRLVVDVAQLTALLRESQPDLLTARHVVSNPTFERSADLGGADADLVLGDMLVELKTVKRAVLDKVTVWQLLGYLLADTTDRYAVRRVGWYFSRQGCLWSMPVDELLERLHGAPADLGVVRAEFAALFAREVQTVGGGVPDEERQGWAKVERVVSFYPNVSGRGRWHVARAQIVGAARWGDPDGPVCGARSVLDLDRDPVRPNVGQGWADDERLCFSCLNITRPGWGQLVVASGGLPDGS